MAVHEEGTFTDAVQFVINAAISEQHHVCIDWPYGKNPAGYGRLRYYGGPQLAHRLVCEIAHGEPSAEFPLALHSCGRPSCVNAQHLRWGTARQNMADKILHGTTNRGERSAVAKLSEKQVLQIKGLIARGCRVQEIAPLFGVSDSTIRSIRSGHSWFWLIEEASHE